MRAEWTPRGERYYAIRFQNAVLVDEVGKPFYFRDKQEAKATRDASGGPDKGFTIMRGPDHPRRHAHA